MPSGSGWGKVSGAPSFSSTPLPHGGCFIHASDQTGVASSSLGAPPPGNDKLVPWSFDEELDLGLEANDEGDGEKHELGTDDSVIDLQEIEILQRIVNPTPSQQLPSMPKSGDKWGSAHLDGSGSSDLSGKDLDTKGIRNKKKGGTPTKAMPNPSQ